jgi:ribokinase
MNAPRVAVVGHVEWAHCAVVDDLPRPGEIVPATEHWEEAAGGGAVAAVQLAKLAGGALFITALGDDERGRASAEQLTTAGVDVRPVQRDAPQRGAFVHLDSHGERTITTLGPRMVPAGADALPWELLADCDAVYFTGGDAAALRAARSARVVVATPRAAQTLQEAGVELDVLVSSGNDAGEAIAISSLVPPPRHVISTLGAMGGRWVGSEGGERGEGTWKAAPLPGPPVDAYGCGDSFAAGLTYGLGAGHTIEKAIEIAALCGAACLTGRGPYVAQLTEAELRGRTRPGSS